MEYSVEAYWIEAKEKLEAMLRHSRKDLDVINYVLLRNTLLKSLDYWQEDEIKFNKDLEEGKDVFVNDIKDDDPLAFILRGAMHVEDEIDNILDVHCIKRKSNLKMFEKIKKLESEGLLGIDNISLLHAVRNLRNPPAHKLEAGRSVTPERAQAVIDFLTPKAILELELTYEEDIRKVEPAIAMKMLLARTFHMLLSHQSVHYFQSEMRRVMRL